MDPAAAVANAVLQMADAEGRALTHMQLQKLVYITHGWHLAVTARPLISETVEAWKYGPVIPELYELLKQFGREPVTAPLAWWDYEAGARRTTVPRFPKESQEVIDRVWGAYKHLNGLQLSTLTHQKGTPWYVTAGELPEHKRRGLVIPERLIQEHYVEIGRRRS